MIGSQSRSRCHVSKIPHLLPMYSKFLSLEAGLSMAATAPGTLFIAIRLL